MELDSTSRGEIIDDILGQLRPFTAPEEAHLARGSHLRPQVGSKFAKKMSVNKIATVQAAALEGK